MTSLLLSEILSSADHELALLRFEQLLDAPEDSPDAVERDRLGDLIYRYEEIHYPIREPTLWQAFKFRLDQAFRHN